MNKNRIIINNERAFWTVRKCTSPFLITQGTLKGVQTPTLFHDFRMSQRCHWRYSFELGSSKYDTVANDLVMDTNNNANKDFPTTFIYLLVYNHNL